MFGAPALDPRRIWRCNYKASQVTRNHPSRYYGIFRLEAATLPSDLLDAANGDWLCGYIASTSHAGMRINIATFPQILFQFQMRWRQFAHSFSKLGIKGKCASLVRSLQIGSFE